MPRFRRFAGAAVLLAVVPVLGLASQPVFTVNQVNATAGAPTPPGSWGEPAVRFNPFDGGLYATSPGGSSGGTAVWFSADLGKTWSAESDTATGGGDSDMAFDSNGTTIYNAALVDQNGTENTTIPVSTSTDHGKTWNAPVPAYPAGGTLAYDRQWIATSPAVSGHVVVIARGGGTETAWVSTDGAKSFSSGVAAASVSETGPLSYSPDGSAVYFPYFNGLDVGYAKSTDGGATWTDTKVGSLNSNNIGFPSFAADRGGNLYLAVGVGSSLLLPNIAGEIDLFTLPAAASAWQGPFVLSSPVHTAIFPWIVASRTTAGQIDIGWWQASGGKVPDDGPDIGSPVTQWDTVVAQTLDGGAANPVFTQTVAVTDFHTGSICTSGLACAGPQNLGFGPAPTPFDRRDLDFFGFDVDSAGNMHIPYPRDRGPANCLSRCYIGDLFISWVDLFVANQTAGQAI